MKNSFEKLAIVFAVLLTGCSKDTGGTTPREKTPDYRCTISWDGYTPSATFSDANHPSKTSEEIAPLFVEKISRRVLSYPHLEESGLREHSVSYSLKSDSTVSFTSSTTNEEFAHEYVDINQQEVLNYLRAETSQEQFLALKATIGSSHDTSSYTLQVPKYGEEQTMLYLASDQTFETDVKQYATDQGSYTFEYLVPSYTYYWKAVSKKSQTEFDGGVFTVNEDNILFSNYSVIGNMRDLGGWKTSENSRIKYNMIYRGRNPDSLTIKQIEALTEQYGFKTQFDLRCDSDRGIGVNICTGVNYYYTNTTRYYQQAFGAFLDKKAGRCVTPDADNDHRLTYAQLYYKLFHVLANEQSYPLYFHCIHGADRTGTLAILIEGLLGVSEEDIVKDYELTSFNSKSGFRHRGISNSDDATHPERGTDFVYPYKDRDSNNGYQGFINLIKQSNGATFKDKVATFLKAKIGLEDEVIESIRNILIEEC